MVVLQPELVDRFDGVQDLIGRGDDEDVHDARTCLAGCVWAFSVATSETLSRQLRLFSSPQARSRWRSSVPRVSNSRSRREMRSAEPAASSASKVSRPRPAIAVSACILKVLDDSGTIGVPPRSAK